MTNYLKKCLDDFDKVGASDKQTLVGSLIWAVILTAFAVDCLFLCYIFS